MKQTIEITGKCKYGLGHSIDNWRTAVIIAHYYKRLLLPPLFNLAGRHNNGIAIMKCDLSDYYNFEDILLDGKPIFCKSPGLDHKTLRLNIDVWRRDPKVCNIFKKHADKCKVDPLTHHPTNIVLKHAKKVSKILDKYNCIHIRKTDCPYNKYMTPGNIINLMYKKFDKSLPVYIMTDHPDPSFFNFLLKDNWSIIFYKAFSELVDIKSKDNYMLFAIELQIMQKAFHQIRKNHLINNYKKIVNLN
jgi:hypothetical protein